PLLCSYKRFNPSPLRVGLSPSALFLSFSYFGNLLVELVALSWIQINLNKATLVVDGNGRSVSNGLCYVVDVNVVAENIAGDLVATLDGSPRETDVRRI